jgi:hypothetical protein
MQFGVITLILASVCLAIVLGVFGTATYIKAGRDRTLAELEVTYEQLRYEETKLDVDAFEEAIRKFDRYSNSVDTAKALFDFQPKMTRDIAERLVAEMGAFRGMSIDSVFAVENYMLSVRFLCDDEKHPVAFTEALIESGYFEAVKFTGYEVIQPDPAVFASAGGFAFTLDMRIKGGNNLEP